MGIAFENRPCDDAGFYPWAESGNLRFFKALPVFVFAFTCHQNMFPVCNEVQNASRERLNSVIFLAYLLCGVIFWISAMLGYATYGENILSNALKGYPLTTVVEVSQLFYSLLAVLSFPMQLHPARKAALALLTVVAGEAPSDTNANRRFQIVTCVLVVGCLTVALLVRDLGIVLGIVGASGSTLVTYILPGIIYMRTFPRNHVKWGFAACQLVAGIVFMPCALFVLLAL